ncbi:MAG: hypothetical protein AAF228_02460 [Pseudomonadota bacterium]
MHIGNIYKPDEAASYWLSQYKTAKVGLVVGGEIEEFMSWVLHTVSHPAHIFATSTLISQLNTSFNIIPNSYIVLKTSRSLELDIETAIYSQAKEHQIFLSDTLEQYFNVKNQTLLQNLAMLTQYEHPLCLVLKMNREYLATALNEFERKQMPSLIIHDQSGILHNLKAPYIYTALWGEQEVRIPEDKKDHKPSARAVQDHMSWLATTDLSLLQNMHNFLKKFSCAPLFEYWREQIHRNDLDANHTHIQKKALERLDQLQGFYS